MGRVQDHLHYLLKRAFRVPVFLTVCLFVTGAMAQTNPVSSHHGSNSVLVNPAMTGSHGGLGFLAGYRYQWTGVPGAPQTAYFSSDIYFDQARSAAGLQVVFDKLGAYTLSGLQLSYAYRQPVGEWMLALGVNAGISLQGLDGSKLITPDGDYSGGTPNHNDDILPTDKSRSVRPELGVGMAWMWEDKLEAGLSLQNLINAATSLDGLSRSADLLWGRTFHVHATGHIPAGDQFSVHPSLSLRTDLNNLQADFSVLGGFRQMIFAGLGYRGYNKNSSGALIPMLAYKPTRNMQIMYSYDADIGTLRGFSSGSHELSLRYVMPVSFQAKSPAIIYHPRFL